MSTATPDPHLRNAIIDRLQELQTSIKVIDLAKSLGYNTKKQINPVLYQLQREGIVTKINEIPPIWILKSVAVISSSLITTNGNSETANGNYETANGKSEIEDNKSETSEEAPTSKTEKVLEETPTSSDSNMTEPTKEKVGKSSLAKVRAEDSKLQETVMKVLQESSAYIPAFKIATQLQTQRSNVNRVLYAMVKNKLVKQIPGTPPLWSINVDEEPKTPADSEGSTDGTDSLPKSPEVRRSRSRRNRKNGPKKSSNKNLNRNTEEGSLPEPNAVNIDVVSLEGLPLADTVNISYSSLTSETFAAMDKNPISAFLEYAQARHVEGKIEIVDSVGPSHNPRFKAVASLGKVAFPFVWDRTKKESKTRAAEVALQVLQQQAAQIAREINSIPAIHSEYDRLAALCHQTFNEQISVLPLGMLSGRKIISAVVMSEEGCDDVVVGLGMGNRCITGDKLNLEGLVVNDSHAEVLARRAFLRFLYHQLECFINNEPTVFEKSETSKKLAVRPTVKFHLYISTAPCGDGALFTRSVTTDSAEDTGNDHRPILSCKTQGLLRTKLESGEGTIPMESVVVLTFDGIQRGDQRLRIMSCSDKICKWNVLGIQGALLTHFLEPVYMSSVILGQLYDHGHLSRAICCRVADIETLDNELPSPYRLNHPALGKVSSCTPTRQSEKTKAHCMNWTMYDPKPEVTDGTTGECLGIDPNSKLCKALMFRCFIKIYEDLARPNPVPDDLTTYNKAKALATDYQRAKNVFYKKLVKLGRGTWIQKPPEEKMFEANNNQQKGQICG